MWINGKKRPDSEFQAAFLGEESVVIWNSIAGGRKRVKAYRGDNAS